MKKTYSIPEMKVVTTKNICVVAGSISLKSNTASSTNGTYNSLGREDNSWDIWGDGDVDYEE